MKATKVGSFSPDSIIKLSTKLKEIFPNTRWKISQNPESKRISALSEPFRLDLCSRYLNQIKQYSNTIRPSVSIQGGGRERTLTLENITLESLQIFEENRDLQTLKKNNIEEKTKPADFKNIGRSVQQAVNDQHQLFLKSMRVSVDNESEEEEEQLLSQAGLQPATLEIDEQDPVLSSSESSIGINTGVTFDIEEVIGTVHPKESENSDALPFNEEEKLAPSIITTNNLMTNPVQAQKTDDDDWEDLTLEGCSCVLMLKAGEQPSVDRDIVSLIPDEKGGMLAYWYAANQLEAHPVALKDISTLKNIFKPLNKNKIDSKHDRFEEVISLCNTPQVKQFYQTTLDQDWFSSAYGCSLFNGKPSNLRNSRVLKELNNGKTPRK